MDFTIDAYAELVSAAAARYRFLRFAESSTEGEVALWRHDIDFSPQRALALARVEASSGVRVTYFVQVSSRYYSIFEPEIATVLRQIVTLGHDIGLHFDAEVCAHQAAPDYDRRIAFEARVLEEVAETSVAAFSLHNPTTLVGASLNEPFRAGLVNGSCSDLRALFSYCSDSNGLWRFRTLAEMIADPSVGRLYALTHPEWWQAEPMPTARQRLQRCIDGRAEFCDRYYDGLLEDNQPAQYRSAAMIEAGHGLLVAGHQPNFLPWFGYFEKMLKCELFVYSDDVQFPKQCYTNRVEIPVGQGATFLTLPVKKGDDAHIADKRYVKDPATLARVAKTLHINFGGLPHYTDVEPVIAEFERACAQHDTVADLNIHMNQYLATLFGIHTPVRRGTELGLEGFLSQRTPDRALPPAGVVRLPLRTGCRRLSGRGDAGRRRHPSAPD